MKQTKTTILTIMISLILFFAFTFYINANTRAVKQINGNRDTSIFLFNDTNYTLTLRVFDSSETIDNNAVLIFEKRDKNRSKILLRDSLFCQRADIQFKHYNNDDIKDIQIFHMFDVRSNVMYYLYLIDNKTKKIQRIKGFEEIKNPEFDPKENLVSSFAVSGTDYYSFYRINGNNKLVDLKRSFDCYHDSRDSINYKKAIKQIRRIK